MDHLVTQWPSSRTSLYLSAVRHRLRTINDTDTLLSDENRNNVLELNSPLSTPYHQYFTTQQTPLNVPISNGNPSLFHLKSTEAVRCSSALSGESYQPGNHTNSDGTKERTKERQSSSLLESSTSKGLEPDNIEAGSYCSLTNRNLVALAESRCTNDDEDGSLLSLSISSIGSIDRDIDHPILERKHWNSLNFLINERNNAKSSPIRKRIICSSSSIDRCINPKRYRNPEFQALFDRIRQIRLHIDSVEMKF